MPAVKTKRISTLIETQLPAFISDEYELFSKFVQKYYEAQEVQGGTLDVINNIQKYADIDFYEKSILKQHDVLAGAITNSDTTITVTDAQSFPKKNGYTMRSSSMLPGQTLSSKNALAVLVATHLLVTYMKQAILLVQMPQRTLQDKRFTM